MYPHKSGVPVNPSIPSLHYAVATVMYMSSLGVSFSFRQASPMQRQTPSHGHDGHVPPAQTRSHAAPAQQAARRSLGWVVHMPQAQHQSQTPPSKDNGVGGAKDRNGSHRFAELSVNSLLNATGKRQINFMELCSVSRSSDAATWTMTLESRISTADAFKHFLFFQMCFIKIELIGMLIGIQQSVY